MEQRQLQEMKSDLSSEGFVRNPQRRALIERWNKWIPGKVKDQYQRYCLAQLYENQLQELNTFKQKHVLGEDTTTTNTAPFIKYTFPLLRRVWPSLIAPEIVSVQPMSAPVGAIFYFELKYGDTKGSVTAGNRLVKDFNSTYSSEYVDAETIGTGTGAQTSFPVTLAFKPVRVNTVKISVDGVSGVSGTDNGAGTISGPGIASGTINYSTGAVTLVLSSAPASGVKVLAAYQFNMEANSLVPSVNIDIALVSVTAKSRKLKALWSSEAADDLKALHGVDAEQELVAGVGSELALEMDREVIEDLRLGATGGSATFDLQVPSGVRDVEHYRGMLTPLTLLSNQIGKNTLRGPANFSVMSYDAAAYIEQLQTHGFFRPIFAAGNAEAMAPAEAPQTWGIMKMGTIQSRLMSYKDPFIAADEVVVGFKGNSFVDAGYVWAPYVPLQVTATFLDPNDFKFRKGLRTRYSKLLCRSEFYAKLKLLNLGSITPSGSGAGTTLY